MLERESENGRKSQELMKRVAVEQFTIFCFLNSLLEARLAFFVSFFVLFLVILFCAVQGFRL